MKKILAIAITLLGFAMHSNAQGKITDVPANTTNEKINSKQAKFEKEMLAALTEAGLTEEEIKKVRAIQDDAYKKTGEIRKDNSLSKEQKEEKAKEINKDKNRKIREVIGKEKFSKFMDIRKRQREEKSTNKEDKSAE
ncbi:MAG TPA: hypothetical protein PLU36_01110 [Chitinophagaceae bacterium]|nr:hypothetical protein [Chitinophagaceae bacterium]MCC6633963.1 hypothetical protein [Chitinophagaceae bacterium]HMZ45378.1 hypothetical protein [Chitinophagaceae bacterium]HNE93247.1 hypothetical protein [Chitinophagaceae bacterium]HNF30237.1 hypothetical protein [Chitinophagaceae bacterium]